MDIRQIYEINKELLGAVDRAVCMFRIGRYDKALEWVADTADEIHIVADAVMQDREYFSNISTELVGEMLQSILDCTQSKDYVLLADLYDMQLAAFICSVQEHILKKEQYLIFDNESYRDNINSLKTLLREMIEERDDLTVDEQRRFRVNLNAKLDDMFDPSALLDKGFNLEFTSSGSMTIAAPFGSGRIYLHTNGRVVNEAVWQALNWYDPIVDEYIVFGLGMGYHIEELKRLAPGKRIVIYENDLDILKLYCAFSDQGKLLSEENVFIVYDQDLSVLQRRIGHAEPRDEDGKLLFVGQDGRIVKVCVHYPSYRRSPGCDALDAALPWKRAVESC